MPMPLLHRAFKTFFLVACVELAAASPVPGQTTEEIEVDCIFTDQAGKPLMGVELGDRWSTSDGRLTPGMMVNRPLLVSDSEGRVRGDWTCCFGIPMLALTADRKMVAQVPGSTKGARGTIVMQPALEITAHLKLPSGPEPVSRAHLGIGWPRPPQPEENEGPLYEAWVNADGFGCEYVGDGRMRLLIPRSPTGRYQLSIRHPSLGDHSQFHSFMISPEVETYDLGTLGIPFSLASGGGHLLPDWLPCEARRLPLERCRPCDFAGQPLVVVLRRFSREDDKPRDDSAGGSLPATLAKHPRRSEFRVLLLQLDAWHHTRGTVESTEPLDVTVVTDLTSISDRVFEGAGLAVLLDRSGRVSHLVRSEADLLEALARELGPLPDPKAE